MGVVGTLVRLDRSAQNTVVRAAWSSAVLNLTLSTRGAKAARAAADRMARLGVGTPRSVDAAHAGRLVNAVCARRPFRSRCLVRSLTLRSVLLRHGIESDLRIGVQRGPDDVKAHAWVEVAGVPVNDVPDVAQEYVQFDLSDRDWSKIFSGKDQRVTTGVE